MIRSYRIRFYEGRRSEFIDMPAYTAADALTQWEIAMTLRGYEMPDRSGRRGNLPQIISLLPAECDDQTTVEVS